MCDAKRKRSPNWLAAEKNLLLDIVEKRFNIIENKRTDGVSMKEKLAEWQAISNEYNSATTFSHRNPETLKAQWESMKKTAKKEARTNRQTGELLEPKKENHEHARIMALIKAHAVGSCYPFDGDNGAPDRSGNEEVMVKSTDSSYNIRLGQLYTMRAKPIQIYENNEKPPRRRTTISASSSTSIDTQDQEKIQAIYLQSKLEEQDKAEAISTLDLEIKKEILKQEKIKTRLLLLELRIKKKQLMYDY